MVIFTPILIEMGYNSYINASDHSDQTLEQLNQNANQVGYIMALINAVLIILFFALYYGLIYGVFLRRLGKNLKDLKNIED